MSDFESANQLAEAGASHGSIPEELSFEEVIKNRTAPVSFDISPTGLLPGQTILTTYLSHAR